MRMKEKIIDDITGVMGGAFGLLADIRDQVRGDMHDRLKGVADRIDLVTRDEMLALEARIAALEAQLSAKAPKAAPAPKAAKPKAKAPAKKKARR